MQIYIDITWNKMKKKLNITHKQFWQIEILISSGSTIINH